MDLNVLSTREETIINFVATFFTQRIYIDRYNDAIKDSRNVKTTGALTDIYIVKLAKYYDFVRMHMSDEINLLVNYFNDHKITVSCAGCVDAIIEQFIPEDHLPDMKTKDKDKCIRTIIINFIKRFVKEVRDNFLPFIMDGRSTQKADVIISKAKEILLDIRRMYILGFVNVNMETPSNKDEMYEEIIKKLTIEKTTLQMDKKLLQEKVKKLLVKLDEYKKTEKLIYSSPNYLPMISGVSNTSLPTEKPTTETPANILVEKSATEKPTTEFLEENSGKDISKLNEKDNDEILEEQAHKNEDENDKDEKVEDEEDNIMT
jgi:hypothetical protein